DNPGSMRDYRLISLCNVLYKMVSKLLANRLKRVLDKCISEEQSAFMEGRYITDNALIAIEIIHALKRKTRGVKGELVLKIDISKAYDKVEWSFLKGVLSKMGFSERWVQWMMLCVSSVNYSALVNFEKVGPIHPGGGLRQGGPLSPYLFILVAEGLTSLINKAVANGELHSVKICRGAPSVSRLLFADDCFIFCRSNLSETRKLMDILKTYEDASVQEINLSKSEIFFSRNISRAAQEDLSNLMGVRHVLGTGTYLGLPSMVGRSKKATFAYIKDRIWRKINYWRSRPLSKVGKEVMIKSVLQAIPTYVMSIYLLPDSLINEIERMINAFWWGGGNDNKGIRWLAWDKLACSKEEGGLGFRDFQMFNMAMVAKQGWNFIIKPTSLVARIFKGRWRIGDGSNIKVMNEPWLRQEEGRWVESPQSQELIQEDKLIWDEESDGVYSVRSGYRKLMRERDATNRPRGREEWGRIWKIQAPPKAKHFLWRICKRLLTYPDATKK
ncbi:RNA-directed DNA polymerase (Reverse transcriptase), partial [Trifolium medium]|nr:RNA-directed DNA polymerase (Reverse transcriptase) [Trifolium medium]